MRMTEGQSGRQIKPQHRNKRSGDPVVEAIRSRSHDVLLDMRHIPYLSSIRIHALLIARYPADGDQALAKVASR